MRWPHTEQSPLDYDYGLAGAASSTNLSANMLRRVAEATDVFTNFKHQSVRPMLTQSGKDTSDTTGCFRCSWLPSGVDLRSVAGRVVGLAPEMDSCLAIRGGKWIC